MSVLICVKSKHGCESGMIRWTCTTIIKYSSCKIKWVLHKIRWGHFIINILLDLKNICFCAFEGAKVCFSVHCNTFTYFLQKKCGRIHFGKIYHLQSLITSICFTILGHIYTYFCLNLNYLLETKNILQK